MFLQEAVDLILTTLQHHIVTSPALTTHRPKLLAVSLSLLSRAQSEFLPCPLVLLSSPSCSSEPSFSRDSRAADRRENSSADMSGTFHLSSRIYFLRRE